MQNTETSFHFDKIGFFNVFATKLFRFFLEQIKIFKISFKIEKTHDSHVIDIAELMRRWAAIFTAKERA